MSKLKLNGQQTVRTGAIAKPSPRLFFSVAIRPPGQTNQLGVTDVKRI